MSLPSVPGASSSLANASINRASDVNAALGHGASVGSTSMHSGLSTLEGLGSDHLAVQGQLVPGTAVGGGGGTDTGVGGFLVGGDQQILKQHELALQRLEELQSDMIGGERGGTTLIFSCIVESCGHIDISHTRTCTQPRS